MALHNETGRLGEELAALYVKELGHLIIWKNWRYKKWEVDLITVKNNLLHFIEVKCRSSSKYGHPEENVSANKIKHLINASAHFLHLHPQWERIQFDVLAITLNPGKKAEYFFIEDVYAW